VEFSGSALDDLRDFPTSARREADLDLASVRYRDVLKGIKR